MNTKENDVSRRDFVRRLGLLGAAGVGGSALLAACGGGASESSTASAQPSAGGDAQAVTITPVGNKMEYEQTAFTVKPDEKVQIVFDNTATSPAMHHNVVVLGTNDDAVVKQVGQAGAKAGKSNDYVPENDAIIAHTPMSKPGETVKTTFTAPSEPGKYTYLCTFPGHWQSMQGTMTVGGGAA